MEKEKNSRSLILGLMFLFASVQLHAAGINPFLFAKDAFFEIATSYVFLVIVAVILVSVFWRIYQTGDWNMLWWAAVSIVGISLITTFAPGTIEFFRAFNPATTVTVSP
jgi:hypothetical protein